MKFYFGSIRTVALLLVLSGCSNESDDSSNLRDGLLTVTVDPKTSSDLTTATELLFSATVTPGRNLEEYNQFQEGTFYYTINGTDPSSSSSSIAFDTTETKTDATTGVLTIHAKSKVKIESTSNLKVYASATERIVSSGVIKILTSSVVSETYTFKSSSTSTGNTASSSSTNSTSNTPTIPACSNPASQFSFATTTNTSVAYNAAISKLGQTFQPSNNITFRRLTIDLSQNSTNTLPGSITAEITGVSSSYPTSTTYGTATIDTSTLTTTQTTVDVDFASNITLTAFTNYAFVLTCATCSAAINLKVYGNSANPYGSGQGVDYVSGTSWLSLSPTDFKTVLSSCD